MVGFPKVNGAGDKQPVVDAKSAGTVNEPGETSEKNVFGSIVRIFDGDAVYNDTLCQVHVDSATGTITGSDRRSGADEDVVPNFAITRQEITNAKGEKVTAAVYTDANGESWVLPPRARILMGDGKTLLDVYCEGEGADFRMRAQITNTGPKGTDDGYAAVISDIGGGEPFTNGGTVDGLLGDGKRVKAQYTSYRFEEGAKPQADAYASAFIKGGLAGEDNQATPGLTGAFGSYATHHERVGDIVAHPVTSAEKPQHTEVRFKKGEWSSMDKTYLQVDTPPGAEVPHTQPIAAEVGGTSEAAEAGRTGPQAGDGAQPPVDEAATSMSFGDYLDRRSFPPASHATAPPPEEEEPDREVAGTPAPGVAAEADAETV